MTCSKPDRIPCNWRRFVNVIVSSMVEADAVLEVSDGILDLGVAVGPHRELSPGPSMAHPAHGLPQEVGGAPNSVGPALAQPRHQHLSGAGGDGQQRVIAPLASVTMVTCPLLGQSIGLADGRVQVDGQRPFAGSRTSGPGPGQQLPAHPIQLADVAPPDLRGVTFHQQALAEVRRDCRQGIAPAYLRPG